MEPTHKIKLALLLAATSIISAQAKAMTDQIKENSTQCEKNWKFRSHNFSAMCFNTKGCRIEYANRYDVNNKDGIVSPPPPDDLLNHIHGSRLGIKNFPRPAEINWSSMDGVKHHAEIDMANIFKDQCIIHNIPKDQIVNKFEAEPPSIVLIVNDRNISVYMKAFVPLKAPTQPDNPYSDAAWPVTLAFSKNF